MAHVAGSGSQRGEGVGLCECPPPAHQIHVMDKATCLQKNGSTQHTGVIRLGLYKDNPWAQYPVLTVRSTPVSGEVSGKALQPTSCRDGSSVCTGSQEALTCDKAAIISRFTGLVTLKPDLESFPPSQRTRIHVPNMAGGGGCTFGGVD